MSFETLKVFQANDLVEDLYDYLSDYFEIMNDAYYRWYTKDPTNVSNPFQIRINQWLIDKGAKVDEKVLFEFSW
jgi:hypothetical protein